MNMKKKKIIAISIACLIAAGAVVAWLAYPRRVVVGFANTPEFMYSRIAQSADAENVEIRKVKNVKEYADCDAVFTFGMGLDWGEEERAAVQKLMDKGLKHMTLMAPNADNNISNLDSTQQYTFLEFFDNGGTANFRNALYYVRENVLGKKLRNGAALGEVIRYGSDVLFSKDSDDLAFNSVKEYETYYREHGMKPGKPKVAVFTSIISPFNSDRQYLNEILQGLENVGFNVYGVSAWTQKLEILQEISPDLVVVFPHGRFAMGNSQALIDWLKTRNIPMLAPLTLTTLRSEWEKDPKGMVGGFLSQSVAVPELDGAIEPFALTALEEENGLQVFKTIPGRLEQFCNLAKKYVALQKMPNSEKKVAIYYYKGPGQNSLVAQGLETLPSLYNTLLSLREAGYNVAGLPENLAKFKEDVMQRGALYMSYAEGALGNFLTSGMPAFVPTDSLTKWIEKTFPAPIVDSIRSHYGKEPGVYYAYEQNGQSGIGVPRIEYGNVAILPQLGTGAGEVDFNMVHGSIAVPSYPYIASYLWTRNAFHADALIHFGTHGSLEFIPGKQIALSSNDFSDRLVNDIPHIYYYTTANVGEAIIAKRRSYAQLVSYLAVPFMDTELRNDLAKINGLIEKYLSNSKDDEQLSLKIKAEVLSAGFHRDLKLDSVASKPYSRTDIQIVDNFLSELIYAKIPGGMYTTGVSFSNDRIMRSARLLSVDPIAYGLSYLDLARGKISNEQYKNEAYFRHHYLPIASRLVERLQQSSSIDVTQEMQRLGVTNAELLALEQNQRKMPAGMAAMQQAMARMAKSMAKTNGAAPHPTAATQPPHGPNAHPGAMPPHGQMDQTQKPQGHPEATTDGATGATPPSPDSTHGAQRPATPAHPQKDPSATPDAQKAQGHPGMPPQHHPTNGASTHTQHSGTATDGATGATATNQDAARNPQHGATPAHPQNGGNAPHGAQMPKGHPNTLAGASAMQHPGGMPPHGAKGQQEAANANAQGNAANTIGEKQLEALEMLRDGIAKVKHYEHMLRVSPKIELTSLQNALNGGYTLPSPGGDYISDPQVLPTGRNLYSINPENTPSAKAWERGKALGDELIADYRSRHNDAYPRKVSFTLWSSSFIESEGTTIAEIFYLLGVEPIRDRMNRVLDVRLMDEQELGRPRIDVVVQTSGQLRDIAASRLFLIQKAVQLAAEAPKGQWGNEVAQGIADAEKMLLEKGLTPAAARSLSQARVFGGLNGSYGTGIQPMVEAGDRWEDRSEIANVYLHNMGAIYGSSEEWGKFTEGAFAAALLNTDAVVQPRQSNTWGALSLDHVYEFMGGLTLAVREVTGKDPEGYMSDLRNRHRARTQELKQAVGVEARTTILNPAYVREHLKESAGAADAIAETILNTYAWNVMKPSIIDKELWDGIYSMYVADDKKLGTVEFFTRENPAALQEFTAAMLETVRKGMWKASAEQIKQISELHTASVAAAGAGCSGMVCDNAKLREFIAQQLPAEKREAYKKAIASVREQQALTKEQEGRAKVLTKESKAETHGQTATQREENSNALLWVVLASVAIVLIAVLLVTRKRKK